MEKKNIEENSNSKPKSASKKPVKKNKVKDEIDYSYLRSPDNEILMKLDKQNNKVKSEAKKNILKMIDKAHNYLYNSEIIEGEDALNDIMNFLFIKFIQPIISDKEDKDKIDLLNKKYYKHLYDDKELTESLFDIFSMGLPIGLSNRSIWVFLDKKRLAKGRNFRYGVHSPRP
jgi:hypothetical protein